jgi:PKHD-type hydroxylase
MYPLLPSPDTAGKETHYAWWTGGFSNDEIEKIKQIGRALETKPSIVGTGGGSLDEKTRKSRNSWIPYAQESAFIYDKLGYIARMLNGEFFEFDLYGFGEPIQYTMYEASHNHYDWHMDRGLMGGSAPRKLSLVLQLSDPHEYDGGDLELFISNQPTVLAKEKGKVYAFPSYIMHRVTPVTRGLRETVVVWLCGNKFR